MKFTYEEIMDIVNAEKEAELMCVDMCRCGMKTTLNPIRKLRCYLDAKRCMEHVFGIDLIIRKIEKIMEES